MRLYLAQSLAHLQVPTNQVNESGKPVVFDVHAFDEKTHLEMPFLLVHDALPKLPDSCGILALSGTLSLLKEEHPMIFVGTRTMTLHEKAILTTKKINTYSMKEITFNGLRETCDAMMANALQYKQLFITVNLDVLDPAYIRVQSTFNPIPGGMTMRELIYFLQRIRLLRNFYGAKIFVPTNQEEKQIVIKMLLELS